MEPIRSNQGAETPRAPLCGDGGREKQILSLVQRKPIASQTQASDCQKGQLDPPKGTWPGLFSEGRLYQPIVWARRRPPSLRRRRVN